MSGMQTSQKIKNRLGANFNFAQHHDTGLHGYFFIQNTVFNGQPYDSVALCVDRLSGWIVAVPCKRGSITAEWLGEQMFTQHWRFFRHSSSSPSIGGFSVSQQLSRQTKAHNLSGADGAHCVQKWV